MSSAARPDTSSASARSSTSAACASIQRVFSDDPFWPSGNSGIPRHSVIASSKRATAWLVSPAAAASRPSLAVALYRDASTSVRGQGPAGSLGEDEAVAESAPQRRDVRLQGLVCRARRIVAPEQLDQRVGRYDRATVQPEHREDGTRLGARDRDRHTVLPNLERPQNPQLHRLKRSHSVIVGGPIQHTVKVE